MEVELLIFTGSGFKKVNKCIRPVSAKEKKMGPVDPQEVLESLKDLLAPEGSLLGIDEAVKFAGLMKEAKKIVNKCIYINVLKVETGKEILEKCMTGGGWDTLNDWLQECREEDNMPMLCEILKVYKALPVTVEILKTNKAAKTIKQLCRQDHDDAKSLAKEIFDEWIKLVQPSSTSNSNDSNKSKKKSSKDRDRERSKSSEKSSDSKDSSRSSRDSSHRHSGHRDSKDSNDSKDSRDSKDRDRKDREKTRSKQVEEDNVVSSSNDSIAGDDKVVVRQGSGLKLHIKLGGDKDKSDSDSKKRPSTVKRPPSKFRSTGLEEETTESEKMPKNADLSKPIPKRTGGDIKSETPTKRSKLSMPPPPTVPPLSSAMGTVTTPTTATSPVSPSETHGKIKLIPARPKSNHEIQESSGFMDSLETSTRTYGAYKKKRRTSTNTPPGSTSKPPATNQTTPPSPVSPTTSMAKSLPSVPSFYKDTQAQESEESPEPSEIKSETKSEAIKEEPPAELGESPMDLDKGDNSENSTPSESDSRERSISPTELGKEGKGLLTTGATKLKKNKKKVSWKPDKDLKEIYFFELLEDERVNVNRPKIDFNQARKEEMHLDRRAVESVRRLAHHDNMREQITWYRPRVVHGCKEIDYGKDSTEKVVQRQHQMTSLAPFFFNKLPDFPEEPDKEAAQQEHEEMKTISLEDVSGGEQMLYVYDGYPKPVLGLGPGKPPLPPPLPDTPPPNNINHGNPGFMPPMPPSITNPLPPMGASLPGGPPQGAPGSVMPPMMPPMLPPSLMGGGPPNMPQGLNLPPDLSAILNQIQNLPPGASNDPVMAQVAQIVNSLMCGGAEQSFEQFQQIQQLGQQMGIPPEVFMQALPPGMMPMGMPPPGPGPGNMGMRGPLLGNAPPGFMPQRQMGPGPPPRFGPGPPGNWGGPNMGGPPNMGGGNFGGRMRGPWQGGRGGRRGGGGPGYRKKPCIHFTKNGRCRMGDNCDFLHPGVNDPMDDT